MKRNMCGGIHMIMQKTINRPWLRVLCVCMVLCMLVGMLPATVSAANEDATNPTARDAVRAKAVREALA